MTVLDTNFLIDVLRGKHNPEAMLDMIDYPKTTTINIFELYIGAANRNHKRKSFSKVNWKSYWRIFQ